MGILVWEVLISWSELWFNMFLFPRRSRETIVWVILHIKGGLPRESEVGQKAWKKWEREVSFWATLGQEILWLCVPLKYCNVLHIINIYFAEQKSKPIILVSVINFEVVQLAYCLVSVSLRYGWSLEMPLKYILYDLLFVVQQYINFIKLPEKFFCSSNTHRKIVIVTFLRITLFWRLRWNGGGAFWSRLSLLSYMAGLFNFAEKSDLSLAKILWDLFLQGAAASVLHIGP